MNPNALRTRSANLIPPSPRTDCAVAHRGQANAGFTLLELLVSMTIVSLLATTILFGWRVASSAWQRANDRLQQQRTVLATHHLLQEQMASMTPYPVRTPAGALELFFQGEPTTSRFVSRYSLSNRTRSGLYRVEYTIAEQSDGTKQLLMNEYPLSSPDELGAVLAGVETNSAGRVLKFLEFERRQETVTLLEGLEECRFEYYRLAPSSEPGWTDQWTVSSDELPRAMAIRAVARVEAGGLRPVSIVAAVQNHSAGGRETERTPVRRSR